MHSYRNVQAAGFNLGIVPGQAELAAIRFIVLMAVLGSLLGVVIWPHAALWSNHSSEVFTFLAVVAVAWLAGSVLVAPRHRPRR